MWVGCYVLDESLQPARQKRRRSVQNFPGEILNDSSNRQNDDEPYNEEHEEQNLRDTHGRAGDSGESQKPRDDRNDEKNQ
jgi:hypothetical protein